MRLLFNLDQDLVDIGCLLLETHFSQTDGGVTQQVKQKLKATKYAMMTFSKYHQKVFECREQKYFFVVEKFGQTIRNEIKPF